MSTGDLPISDAIGSEPEPNQAPRPEITDEQEVLILAILLAKKNEYYGLRLKDVVEILYWLRPYKRGQRPPKDSLESLITAGYVTTTEYQVGTAGSKDTFYKAVRGKYLLHKL